MECYLTFEDIPFLFTAYLCMTLSLSAIIPTIRKRFFSLVYALLISVILILLVQAGMLPNLYEELLNI